MAGNLHSIYIAAASRAEVEPRREALLVAGTGIVGDRHCQVGQCAPEEELTLVAAEELDGFNERTSLNVPYGAVRRNLVTVGVDLNSLVGVRFKIGAAEAEGMELCEPCAVIGKLLASEEIQPKDVIRELRHRGGLRARIVAGGTIRVGDEIRAITSQCRLIEPTAGLEGSHQAFVCDFQSHGEKIVPWIAGEPYRLFDEYVAMLHQASVGIDLPSGFVAHSTYWLLDAADEIVAVSNLRHELTNGLMKYGGHIGYGVRPSARRQGHATEVLRRTLVEAKKIGIRRARLTCDKGNIASEKTILRNGGWLDEEEFMPEHGGIVSRYWIDLERTE